MRKSGVLFLLMVSGCLPFQPAPEFQRFERIYPYTLGEVWTATVAVMERKYHVLADPVEYTVLTTEWNWDFERDPETGTPSETNWKERYKYTITLQTAREGILVTILPLVEKQVPTQYGGVRWVRANSDGKREKIILSQIEATLSRARS